MRKPNPKIFKYALEQANALPENSIMIGDDLEADVMGAIRVGIQGIYFNPKEEFHSTSIDKEINCLSELKKLL